MDRKLRLIRHKSCIHGSCICRGLSTSWSPCPLVGGLERREQTFLGRASKQVCAFLWLDTRQVVALRHGGTVQFSMATCKSRPCPAGPKWGTRSGPAGGSRHTHRHVHAPAGRHMPISRWHAGLTWPHLPTATAVSFRFFPLRPPYVPSAPSPPAPLSLPPLSARLSRTCPPSPLPFPSLSLSLRPPPRRRLRATAAAALAAVLGGPCAPNEQVSPPILSGSRLRFFVLVNNL
ncbi:hypothetical protein GQ55_2G247500 [Panicum hallii var. hallii]|uniref:Uncharacterized protein n=1 Tax=Panicum hallii var. hallii TaxID=1504633 RepID=A0A2T7ES13_9POAL|nr:hypothetical protein GQ55_2G247500 [Panicum hallii var. hallii]